MNTKKLVIFFTLIVSLIVITTGCAQKQAEGEEPVTIKQVDVQITGTQTEVTNRLKVSGTVTPKQYSVIRSLTPGTIEFITPAGTDVIIGQSLYRIRDANIENSFFNAQRNFDQTLIITGQRVTQAELALASAKASLDSVKINWGIAERQAAQNLDTAITSAITAYASSYNVLNQALVVLSRGSLDSFNYTYSNLPTSETGIRSNVSTQLGIAVGRFLDLSEQAAKDLLDDQLTEIQRALIEANRVLDMTAVLLQSAIISVDLTQASVDSDKSLVATYQSQANLNLDRINAAKSALTNTVIASDLNLERAQSELNLAQIQYDNAAVSLLNSEESAELEKSISRSQFDAASYNYSNLALPSPFTGTVLSNFVNEGEQVSVGRDLLEVGNISLVEIAVEVDATLASGLKSGDRIIINDNIEGFISEIEPAGDLSSGKVSVVVRADNMAAQLVSGNIAEVNFELKFNIEAAIIIPIKSTTIEDTGTTVFVIEDGKAAERKITLGRLYGDKVAVVDGLFEGDILILPSGIFITIGEEVEARP